MSSLLARILQRDGPGSIPLAIRRFTTFDPALSRDVLAIDGDGWVIQATEPVVTRLFEVPDPGAEQCMLTYRAAMKSQDLEGRAFLEMWCRLPGRGEFFSRGLNRPIRGTTDWSSYEIPFRLKKGERPDLIKLDLAVEGRGKVWIKDIELLKTPR